ncbi:MAG: BatD family protein [Candidatus Marinimicrobia bacterium]|nr:BatD family protein [Candidatus Neomarinimicrobiota bacterium]MCF7850688.1 BatD family protein [Candidatus Neomarinimicrobiota bacterium]
MSWPSFLLILLIGLAPHTLLAQPKITSSVDARQILVQESFTWKVEVEGSDAMPQVNLPDIENLALLSGPMQSSNYSYVNGKMSARKSISYTFVAMAPGTIIFPAVEVFLGNDRTMTEPHRIQVIASRKAANDQSQQTEQSVFIRALPTARSVYVGEPITVRYKLYTQVGVYNYQVDKLPDAVGFWAEEVKQSSQPRLVSEVIDGVRYNTAVLKTVIYYPTRSGELLIDPLRTELEIEVKSNRKGRRLFNDPFFNDPFFSGTRKATKNFLSNQLKIKVKALPEPRPAGFSGAVGSFNIKADLDTNAVLVNDAVGLNVTLSGRGNFNSLKIPDLQAPEGVDMFKPERSESVSIRNFIHQGSKNLTYLLVPRKAGRMAFDPVKFVYFDPSVGKYMTQSSGPLQLMVYNADGNQPIVTSGYSREEVELMQEDIRYIKALDDKFYSRSASPLGFNFWTFHILAVFGILGVYAYQYWSTQLAGNEDLRRSVTALKTARSRLQQAEKLGEDSPELRTLLHQCISGFIGDRLNAPQNALDTIELVGLLRARQIDAKIVAETRHFLEGLTMDRFAPGAEQKTAAEWVAQTKTLLQELRKVI